MSNSKPATIRIVAIRQPFALFESRPWRPPLNMYETNHGIKLVADLAGISWRPAFEPLTTLLSVIVVY